MKGRSARAKGGKHERSVAAAFRAVVPTAKRGIGQSRGGGAEVPDVVIPHLHVECKHRKAQSLYDALRQATRDCPAGKTPCAVVKLNRMPNVVAFELDAFIAMFGTFLRWMAGGAASVDGDLAHILDAVRSGVEEGDLLAYVDAAAERARNTLRGTIMDGPVVVEFKTKPARPAPAVKPKKTRRTRP